MSKKLEREFNQFTKELKAVSLTCPEKQSLRQTILSEAGVVKSPSRFWSLTYWHGRVKDYLCMKINHLRGQIVDGYKTNFNKFFSQRAF